MIIAIDFDGTLVEHKYPEIGKNAEGEIIEVLGGGNEAGVDMLSLIKYK